MWPGAGTQEGTARYLEVIYCGSYNHGGILGVVGFLEEIEKRADREEQEQLSSGLKMPLMP